MPMVTEKVTCVILTPDVVVVEVSLTVKRNAD
jgi:hypothetical protein